MQAFRGLAAPSCALGVVLLLASGLASAGAADWPADPPLVAEPIRQAMQERNYPEAIKAIDLALRAKDARREYLVYLKGWALHLDKKYAEAIAVFDGLDREFPKGRWVRRARFAKAVSLARTGDFRAAELIYRAEAEFLLSDGRRQELAQVYLEFADALFKPPKEDQKPDYEKALALYTQALQFNLKPEQRAEVELRAAQCHQELGRHAEAARLYAKFTQDHPQSPLDVEARYRLGQCRLAEKNRKEARRVWQDLLAKHPDAKSDRAAQAAFDLAKTWGIPAPQSDEDLSRGVAALDAFLERFPLHKLAGQAEMEIVESYRHRGRQENAVARLVRFVKDERYKDRPEMPQAWNVLGRTYRDQKKFAEALAAWREYLARFPVHEATSGVQQEIVNTEYQMGLEAYKSKDYARAVTLLTDFLARHPLDARGPGIFFLFGQMSHEQKKFEAAIADWRRLVSKYPGTNEASHAQWMIAQTLENDLGKLGAALDEYRKVTWGSRQGDAQQAIRRLREQRMTIATERTFRSDQTPRVRLTTRNLESVGVRAYKVDLETYFRKTHTAKAIEQLDIALIDPDRSVEFQVPKYAKHQELQSQIDVPLAGEGKSGVMAVTVSSKTLEATTLVIQTDLEIVVKSSRDEVFVFAENLRTGKPWPGARVLVSNGRQIVAEGVTDAQGVFRQAIKELKDADDVRVFAVADGHVASTELSLKDLVVARPLEDKGYVYTDRPVYRPGERVAVRGCIRRAAGDAWTVEKEKKFTLDVLDSRNRMVRQESVALGSFGTFHTAFALPPNSPPGKYRVVARDETGKSYQGEFEVRYFQPEPIRLEIHAPRTVYYRGEAIEGTIRAAWHYGAPLAGREVRYQLADEPALTAKTDAKGEVRFTLPTREFAESARLELRASLTAENVQSAKRFVLATRGFSVFVKTARPFFVSGEPFEAEVTARDAEGKPAAEKLALRVLELTFVEGKVGERLVEEHAVATAADGKVRQTLKLAKGGRYRLRAEGTDRFKNAISGDTEIQVCDDEDQTRLRILADRHEYRAGDTAEVVVYWREAPALALVTCEAGRVLDYRLVELKTGPNKLSLAMTSRLAPNFQLAVAVVQDPRPQMAAAARPATRFHLATSEFSVVRELNVAITWRRKDGRPGPATPGEPIEVTIVTTDPQGKPVAAEVSLAMAPELLWSAWTGGELRPGSALHDFFIGEDRDVSVRSESSIRFRYDAQTQPINPRLLAERDRQEIAQEEEASRRAALADRGGAMAGAGFAGGFGGFGGSLKRSAAPRTPEGAAMADFDSLIALIESTVHPKSWAPAALRESRGKRSTNLSLVVSQTQEMEQLTPEEEVELAERLERRSGRDPERIAREELPRIGGYWAPAIVTGPDGKATITLTVPEPSNAWMLLAEGITVDTLAGGGRQRLVARKPLFAEMKLPSALTEGDQPEIAVTVHNDLVDKGPIEVTLRTTIGARTVEEKKTIEVKSKGIHEITFSPLPQAGEGRKPESPLPPAGEGLGVRGPRPDSLSFDLTLSAAGQTDTLRRRVPLVPYGAPVYATAGGTASADATVWIEPPKEMPIDSPRLVIVVGPTVERSLLDIVLAPAPTSLVGISCPAPEVETATSDLMAALALQKLLGASRDAGGPAAPALDARIRGTLGQLALAQNDNGGWSWTGRGGASDPYSSARVVWALALARRAGYPVADEPFNKALAYLRTQSAAVDNNDYESRAILLHALTVAGHADFAVANHLHRQRASLSPAALAYLALTFAEMDRKTPAGEVLDLVAKQDLDAPRCLPWSLSPVELRALYALASQAREPKTPKTRELVDWLLQHRTGHRWTPDKATGPAALALAAWFGESRFEGEHYKLAVSVNDKPVETLDVADASATRSIEVPPALVGKDKVKVRFQITGRGRYAYQCLLWGFVPAEKLKSTTSDWEVQRRYEPAPLEVDGRAVPRGFGVVQGEAAAFHNRLTQLPVARQGLVELTVRRKARSMPTEPLEYLVLAEPLPAGVTVDERSIRGGFERCEILPGAIVFYLGNRRTVEPIRFEIHGYLPGRYRAAPAVLRNAYRPDQFAVAAVGGVSNPSPAKPNAGRIEDPSCALAVLPLGAASTDPYRLSPVELFELGKHAAGKRDWKTAAAHLTELVEKWNLNPEVYKTAVQTLLDAHLELGPAAKVVHYFEIVKERWPDVEVPFAKIVRVAAAYHDMGEFERSYLVYRATVEGSFTRETGVAGFLEEQDEFLRSVEFMARLACDYPPESYVAEAEHALAQQVHAKAPLANDDPKLREKKVNRVDLVRRTWTMLEVFLTAWPEDPAADRAAFAAANTLLEMKDYAQAAAASTRYAARYPKSDLVDAFWYVTGYSQFALGRHKEAIEMCRRVAEHKGVDRKTGRTVESPNRHRAIYILGQIHHTLGQPAEAIREYRRVEDRFSDAKLSIAWYLRKAIDLPEVTTVKPGQPAEVELKFRNLAACDVKAYRIDLMKFSLLKGDLGGITRINLAGIRPLCDASVKLGDGLDYRDRTHKLPLPLAKEGAYLVVCRGEDLHASGLVLVTPLAVEVQVDRGSGQVRTMVKDTVADRYLSDAEVRVIGSGNQDFVAGTTDFRGVFTAEGVRGRPTVIAQAGPGRYAFFRGAGLRAEELPDAGLAGPAEAERPRAAQSDPFSDPFAEEKPAAPDVGPQPKPERRKPIAPSPEDLARIRKAEEAGGLGAAGFTGVLLDDSMAKVLAALASPTTIECVDTPLANLAAYLKELHGIPVEIDRKALDDAGVGVDTPITASVKGVTLRSALNLILRNVDLSYTIVGETLLITTAEEASNRLVTVLYPVGDLVSPPGSTSADEADYDSLIDTITSTVQPTTWDAVGGPGSIGVFENKQVLVLSQTMEVHQEISSLLGTLRKLGGPAAAAGQAKIAPPKPRAPVSAVQKSRLEGGMMMGFGGMGGFGGQTGRQPAARRSKVRGDDLLGGLQEANQEFQEQGSGKLKARYKKGMGMGGMGGGIGAGGAY